nr:DUF6088 family protein [Stutzerimonas kunmingensis]
MVDLSTVAGNKISNPPWVKFQSAGWVNFPSAPTAVRRLGLSTQMQVVPVYYTSGRTREIKAGNAVVRLNHVSSDRLQHAGNKVGLALTALYYLGKDGACPHALSKIADTLSPDELTTLLACSMPKWMRAALATFAEEASLAVSSGS